MEKSHDLGKDVRDGGRAAYSITCNKGKEPVILDNVDTLADDELFSRNSPSLSLSPTKNAQESAKAKLRKRPSHHLTFSDVVSIASCRAGRETSKWQNHTVQALRNASVLPEGVMPLVFRVGTMPLMLVVHPTFGTG